MNNTLSVLINHYAEIITRETDERPDASKQIVWWMLEAIMRKSKTILLIKQEMPSEQEHEQLNLWVNRYVYEHMPLQYIIGSAPFISSLITCKPPMLIPRPETEEWVNELCSQLAPYRNQQLTIADVGTGSGCIAIALAQALPKATIYALDCDERALDLTRINCIANNTPNIIIMHSDVLSAVTDVRFDLIVSNPPYIPEHEYINLEPRVKEWEAPHALTADNDGLAIITKIIYQAYSLTSTTLPFRLVLEIGYNQGNLVCTMVRNAGFTKAICHSDNAGNDRVVYCA